MVARYIRTAGIVAVIIGSVTFFAAADNNSDNDYDKKIEIFFSQLQAGAYQQAVDFIYSDNPWISAKSDEVQKLKTQFVGLPDLLGSYLSYERLVKVTTANRLVFIQYFVAFERQPIKFTFQFYKPRDKWMIFSFSYADDIEEMLVEKAQYNFLHDIGSQK